MSEYPDVISPEEIKEILRISTSGVYHLLQAGTIKSIRVGKRYIIPKQSIAKTNHFTDDELEDMRREAINNVRRTRGRIKLEDIAKGWYNEE